MVDAMEGSSPDVKKMGQQLDDIMETVGNELRQAGK